MEVYTDRFLILEGSRFKLLCRDAENLYLVTLGKVRGTPLERQLKQLPVAQMLTLAGDRRVETIPLQTLYGFSMEGTEDGDLFYLCLSKGWRPMILRQFLSLEFLDAFFHPVSQFPFPEDGILDRDHPGYWRVLLRDPRRLKKRKWIEIWTANLGGIAAIGFAVQRDLLWFCLCTLCVLIPLILDICLPGYFTLEPHQKKSGNSAVFAGVPLLLVGLAFFFTNDHNLSFPRKLIMLAFHCALGVTALMLLAREFRQHKQLLAGLFLWAFLFSVGFLQNANVLLPQPEPEIYSTVVVNFWHSRNAGRRSHDTYHCTVVLPEGSRKTFQISKEVYDILSTGYCPPCYRYQGALGMEYYTLNVWGEEFQAEYGDD